MELPRIFLFLTLLKLTNFQYNTQNDCPAFYCTNLTAPNNGVCFLNFNHYSNRMIQVKKCPFGQFCNINFDIPTYTNYLDCSPINMTTLSNQTVGNLVEADNCRYNSDCASGNCVNNSCVGKPLGNQCSSTNECNYQGYCDSNGRCSKRKTSGLSCNIDYECVNTAECMNNTCTTLYSIKSGNYVSKQNYSNRFCQSNYSNPDGMCEDLINIGNKPYLCGILDGCNYTTSIKNTTYNSQQFCNCDFSGNSLAYCSLGTNTSEYLNFINATMYILSYNCHFFNKNRCSLHPDQVIRNRFVKYFQWEQVYFTSPCFDIASYDNFNAALNCTISNCSSMVIKFQIFLFAIFAVFLI